ncbi:ABC transporter permease [Sandaracinus amylolyticus]|uniref:ABC transporter permease n=1 Tax=Sandaracinus amylolyticus TaxID=927083 RepID=UPI001F2093A9|nr:ABC transporter permease [Sandaracinus amylolyticus]UJR80910.1 Binding-protein-dependent transport systems inner membrane component [Sandaracinus amylolyticus]
MTSLLARRLLRGVLVVWAAVSLVFLLAHGAGDPAVSMLGARATPERVREFNAAHGLDAPLHEQYARFWGGVLTGDLGTSWRDEQPVARVLGTRLPRTMLLGGIALALEVMIGLGIGTLAALRRNGPLDTLVMAIAFLGISAPTFLTGLVFLQIFAFRLGWFPVGGYGVDALDHVRHAMLPALTLAIVGAATYARIMRSEMIETLRQDYVRTARAKGLSPIHVVRHAFRNALLPIVTLLGLSTPLLVSGAVITETIYGWPGVGRLAVESISSGDVPILLGVVLVASIAVQLGNLGADLAVARLDPRIRLDGGSR